VVRGDIYDPTLNPLYADVLRHYGVVGLPCRVGNPRVSPVGHNHPEIPEKIDEVEDNVRRFAESFGKSLLAMQRRLEQENLSRAADGAFATIPEAIKKKLRPQPTCSKPSANFCTASKSARFTKALSTFMYLIR
jgi:hypothetical protein